MTLFEKWLLKFLGVALAVYLNAHRNQIAGPVDLAAGTFLHELAEITEQAHIK